MERKIKIDAGLEVHQQLDSNRKLFCNCPPILRKDSPDVIVHRKLHAVVGEEGEVDLAVQYEAEKEKEFIYEGYSDTNCLLEYDESLSGSAGTLIFKKDNPSDRVEFDDALKIPVKFQ